MEYIEQRKRLVKKLVFDGRISSERVKKAFLETPRELFVPEKLRQSAYFDTPLHIGSGQTISAPHMVAIMVEALNWDEAKKILEIGTGSGYHAAVVSKIVGKNAKIYSIETIEKLAKQAEQNLKKANIENVIVKRGDGSLGLKEHSPFDIIYVTCASPDIPKPFLDQLSEGGQLLIPVGNRFCELELIQKRKDELIKKHLGGCAFVPLVGKYGF